ncbi:hypothetical protein BZA77DRAFT_133461 [Pyronema omphalodes]|nr:hypothetical protein BZA77DRAFT_133461 [Pyronema omphalodes]
MSKRPGGLNSIGANNRRLDPTPEESNPRPQSRNFTYPLRPVPQLPSPSQQPRISSSGSGIPISANAPVRPPRPSLPSSSDPNRPSMQSERSIYIGFDPSNSGSDSLAPPKRLAPNPPPSSRRAASSYYSQQTVQVSPIPEEPGSRHESYASSSAIPTKWEEPGPVDSSPEELEEIGIAIEDDGEIHGIQGDGLVRQASLGRKQKAALTDIKGPRRSNSSTPQQSATPVSKSSASNSPIDNNTGGIEANLAVSATTNELPSTDDPQSITRRPERNSRRPPRLNIDAVRDAEARGSLTSLPDLIRRATKLAAALETGRPGSLAWGRRSSGIGTMGGNGTNRDSTYRNDTDSISDILAAFPAPGRGRQSNWFIPAASPSITPSQRRIFGLPVWAFIVLVLLAIVIITIAVIVPVQLVSISKSNAASARLELMTKCRKSNPCSNGGENIATTNFCGCVCINGFTGDQCTVPATNACVAFNTKDRENITIGSALPRLLEMAEGSYGIQLDVGLLMAVFSRGNVGCAAMNALVNIVGKTGLEARKRWMGEIGVKIRRSRGIRKREREEGIGAGLHQRQIQIPDTSALTLAAATPTPTPTTPTPTLTSTSITATSSGSTTPSQTPTSSVDLNQDTLDFARVAVLFIAQNKGLSTADKARLDLDATFRSGVDSGNVTSGDAVIVLDDRRVVLDGNSTGGVAKGMSG